MILDKEIDIIHDERLRESARLVLNKARLDFLRIYPGSLGGKYHPPDERGPGGLLKHIKRIVHILHEVAPHFGLTQEEHDILIYCGLLHDISNLDISENTQDGIVRDQRMYNMWHADMSANLATMWLNEPEDMTDETVLTIQGIIRSHMGAWYKNNRQPSNKLEIIFSLVDFIVSRENIRVDVK